MPLALVGLVDLFEHVERRCRRPPRGRRPVRPRPRRPRGAAAPRASRPDSGGDRRRPVARLGLCARSAVLAPAAGRGARSAPGRATRLGSGGEDRLAAAGTLPPGRCEALDLGPLGIGALRRVLRASVETISRPTLQRIHEVSGGNPLYALELARGLPRGRTQPARREACRSRTRCRRPSQLRLARMPRRAHAVARDGLRARRNFRARSCASAAGDETSTRLLATRGRARAPRRRRGARGALLASARRLRRVRAHEPARSSLAARTPRRAGRRPGRSGAPPRPLDGRTRRRALPSCSRRRPSARAGAVPPTSRPSSSDTASGSLRPSARTMRVAGRSARSSTWPRPGR